MQENKYIQVQGTLLIEGFYIDNIKLSEDQANKIFEDIQTGKAVISLANKEVFYLDSFGKAYCSFKFEVTSDIEYEFYSE
nr:hypothetical protein [uncultured Flavobacterium sp.]